MQSSGQALTLCEREELRRLRKEICELKVGKRYTKKGIDVLCERNEANQHAPNYLIVWSYKGKSYIDWLLDGHLGYDEHHSSATNNSRNSYPIKTLITEDDSFNVDIPRDRTGDFEPQLIKKRQTRFTSMDDKIQCLYVKDMSIRGRS